VADVADDAIARAIACFEQSDDVAFLRDVLRAIRPRAEAAARRHEQAGRRAPDPMEVAPSAQPATPQDAMKAVRATKDFAQLQAMARAAGRRVEQLNA
jgi:hypothetical protein